jgi:catechol 2,3-dioxygenase-like lactoylglutathione lyase family enzyme
MKTESQSNRTGMVSHLSLNVKDVDDSVRFYESLFGQAANKRKPGYAKFEVDELNLVFSLVKSEGEKRPFPGHLGIKMLDKRQFDAVLKKYQATGVPIMEEDQVSCCYALQDKFWVNDPDGNPWEVYFFHEDVEANDKIYTMSETGAACCTPGTCC